MISDVYKKMLVKLAIELDDLTQNKLSVEKNIQSVLANENTLEYLEIIREISQIPQSNESTDHKKIQFIEMLYTYLGATQIDGMISDLKNDSNISLEESLKKLNGLIGLENVKQQVHDLIAYNKIQKLRKDKGIKVINKTMHMAFLGNPGTAKTTCARIIGHMYKSLGLLSKGHFIEASRTDLIAEYQGQTAIKVKKLINRAKGGVLFIDEAYSITENESTDSYGRECLTELTKALEDYRDDLVVIVAGYTDLMEDFFKSNPGLKSRFNTFIQFDDYTLEELVEIFQYICDENEYLYDKDVLTSVRKYLNNKLQEQDKHFANGRFVRNLFDDVTVRQAKRLARNLNSDVTKMDLITLKVSDIPSVIDEK